MSQLYESPIATMLRQHRITAAQLASRAILSVRTVERWMHNAARLHKRTGRLIARALGIDQAEIEQLTVAQRCFLRAAAAQGALRAAAEWSQLAKQLDDPQLRTFEIPICDLDALIAELPGLRARIVDLQAASAKKAKRRIMRPPRRFQSDTGFAP